MILAALIAGLAFLAGCGGAECDALDFVLGCSVDDEDDVQPITLTIGTPSIDGSYVTTAESVRVAGTTSDSDADIHWTNSAGGEGDASPEWEPCFVSCQYDWSIVVSLAYGDNLITVVASNDTGSTVHTIRITRNSARAQWSWVR